LLVSTPQKRGEGDEPITSPSLTHFVRETPHLVRNIRFCDPAIAAEPPRDEPASNVCAP
jgi:hypothetical protein